MHCTYVLHLGALLKSVVATILFSNHHHNHNVIHPTVSMITVLLTHTNTQNDVHTWMQGSSSTHAWIQERVRTESEVGGDIDIDLCGNALWQCVEVGSAVTWVLLAVRNSKRCCGAVDEPCKQHERMHCKTAAWMMCGASGKSGV